MKIPTKFQLAGQVIDVEAVSGLVTSTMHLGECCYQNNLIKLHVGDIPRTHLEQNFCHELVHYILYMMGEDEVNNSEKFVDGFAHYLHQFMNSQKGTLNASSNGDDDLRKLQQFINSLPAKQG